MGFEQIPNIDKQQKELDKEHAALDKKEYITPNDIEKKKKIEEEHQKLSDQVKEIEKGKDIEEIDEKKEKDEKKEEPEKKEADKVLGKANRWDYMDYIDKKTSKRKQKILEDFNKKSKKEQQQSIQEIEQEIKNGNAEIQTLKEKLFDSLGSDVVSDKILVENLKKKIRLLEKHISKNLEFKLEIYTAVIKQKKKSSTKGTKEKSKKEGGKEEKESKEPSAAKVMDDKDMDDKEKKGEENKEKENLEKEITKRYRDELEKIKNMPDDTGELKKEKTEKYFQLVESWINSAYLDDYKGINEIFSDLDALKPSMFFYNFKRANTIDKVSLTMASNYKEWNIKDKEKLKIIKDFINERSKEKNPWYQSVDKDSAFKEIAEILVLEDIPFKENLDIIVRAIENPSIKSKTIAKILEIEKETIEEKKELLKEAKEKMAKEKIPSEEKVKEQLKEMGASSAIEKILQDPEALSKIFYEASEISKNPEVQEKFQELKNTIEKIIKGKEEISGVIKNAKELIQGKEKKTSKFLDKIKESGKTAFGAISFSILFFLIIFMLLELKGAEVLSGQAEGKKKK